MKIGAVTAIVFVAIFNGGQVIAEETLSNGLANRFQLVEKLIEQSSAAAQVTKNGNADANAQRDSARQSYQQAVEAHQAGDNATAKKLLDKATKEMFSAVKSTLQKHGDGPAAEQRFADRLESVNALVHAHNRVAEEKSVDKIANELRVVVGEKTEQAQALWREGKASQAKTLLDEAYIAAKVAIESLRGGETLVRTLTFKSKEEEYVYELDRNETHKMLVSLLLKDKLETDAGTKKLVQGFMDKAASARKQAETNAEKGEYESAVELLENSTKDIVRAIRSAGVYIPG